jgi:hypothetical protein
VADDKELRPVFDIRKHIPTIEEATATIPGKKVLRSNYEESRQVLLRALMVCHQESGRTARDWSLNDQRVMDIVSAWCIGNFSDEE